MHWLDGKIDDLQALALRTSPLTDHHIAWDARLEKAYIAKCPEHLAGELAELTEGEVDVVLALTTDAEIITELDRLVMEKL